MENSENTQISYLLKGICVLLAILMLFSSAGFAQDETASQNYDALKASVAEALKTETKNIENLKNQLGQAEQSKKSTLEKINAYKIQLPIFNNLLLQPEITIQDLEKAWLEIQTTVRTLSESINDFSAKQDTVAALLVQNRDQSALTEKQIADTRSEVASKAESTGINEQIRLLLKNLYEKKELLTSLNTTYLEIIEALKENKQNYSQLSDKFDEIISKRKKQELLERKTSLISIGLKQIFKDFKQFSRQAGSVLTPSFWTGQIQFVWTSGGFYVVSFVLLFFMIQVMMYRLRQYLKRIQDHPELSERFWKPSDPFNYWKIHFSSGLHAVFLFLCPGRSASVQPSHRMGRFEYPPGLAVFGSMH